MKAPRRATGKWVRTRAAWGVYCGAGQAYGGALPSGSTVQDAEVWAVRQHLRRIVDEAGDAATERRVLMLVDSRSALDDIEGAWRAGRYSALRLRHRRGMLEDIVRCRLQLGAVVFLWVRGHGGIVPNAMADTVAKAYLDEPPEDARPRQTATLIRYGVHVAGGAVATTPADRRPTALAERLAAAYVRRWLTELQGGRGDLLVDWAALEGDESGLWRAVLRLSSEGSEVDRDVRDGGRAEGTRRRASRVGAVMMLRWGQMGAPAETGPGEDVRDALMRHGAGAEGGDDGDGALRNILELLGDMQRAVPTEEGTLSTYHATVAAARMVVQAMAAGDKPAAEAWEQARQVLSGLVPEPPLSAWGDGAAPTVWRASGGGDGGGGDGDDEEGDDEGGGGSGVGAGGAGEGGQGATPSPRMAAARVVAGAAAHACWEIPTANGALTQIHKRFTPVS